jgi:hypothetical protein
MYTGAEWEIVDTDVTLRGLPKKDRNDRQVWRNAASEGNPIMEIPLSPSTVLQ